MSFDQRRPSGLPISEITGDNDLVPGKAVFLSGHLDQIGLVIPDLKVAMDGYIANFDVRFHVFDVDQASSSFSGSSSNFQIRFAVAQVGLSSIELIQPLSGRTIYSAHLKKHGSGMHHIGRYVADLPKATSRLKQRGYEVLMEGRIQGLGQFAYFAVPDLHCVIELLQLSRSFPLFLAEKGTIYTG